MSEVIKHFIPRSPRTPRADLWRKMRSKDSIGNLLSLWKTGSKPVSRAVILVTGSFLSPLHQTWTLATSLRSWPASRAASPARPPPSPPSPPWGGQKAVQCAGESEVMTRCCSDCPYYCRPGHSSPSCPCLVTVNGLCYHCHWRGQHIVIFHQLCYHLNFIFTQLFLNGSTDLDNIHQFSQRVQYRQTLEGLCPAGINHDGAILSDSQQHQLWSISHWTRTLINN